MKITTILGNGYDIQYGMKTGYLDFYKWVYKFRSGKKFDDSKPVEEWPDLTDKMDYLIYREIKADSENWSDFEQGLCTFCKENLENEPDESKREKFAQNVLQSLDFVRDDLIEYLNLEQKKLVFSESDDSKPVMNTTMQNLLGGLKPKELQSIRSMIRSLHLISDYTTLGFVSFNYTATAEKVLRSITNIDDRQIFSNTRKTFAVDRKILHVHGVLEGLVMLGGDNYNQIGGKMFPKVLEKYILKPESLKNDGELIYEKMVDTIDKTDVFVTFGLSFGQTDQTYWNMIAHNLLTNSDHFLIINQYNRNHSRQSSYRLEDMERRATKDLFLNHLNINDKEKQAVEDRIFVKYNNQQFMRAEYKYKG